MVRMLTHRELRYGDAGIGVMRRGENCGIADQYATHILLATQEAAVDSPKFG